MSWELLPTYRHQQIQAKVDNILGMVSADASTREEAARQIMKLIREVTRDLDTVTGHSPSAYTDYNSFCD
jgi:hypothetical protein